jgi:uncharacterized protein YcaQ
MYKPVAKRQWGYYALPILQDDRLVGKVDSVVDRERGVLVVKAIHEDAQFSRVELLAELQALADWLGVELAMP